MPFIVNEKLIHSIQTTEISLLTFLREDLRLHGIKAGCREGDCGACTVLVGSIDKYGKLKYQTAVSCLMPLGNCNGKHIITIEGIAQKNLNILQSAIVEKGASQCGFCTPGIIMSLIGHMLSDQKDDVELSLDGNICRCTGYKSIQRAIDSTSSKINGKNSISRMVSDGILPKYLLDIGNRLKQIHENSGESHQSPTIIMGGGTDLMLQKPEILKDADLRLLSVDESKINIDSNSCHFSGNTTIASLCSHKELSERFPELQRMLRLFASTPIRNMATVAGNIVNASPIGDLSILLLALNAKIILSGQGSNQSMALDKFFQSYKKTALQPGHIISQISFVIPSQIDHFSFEKISKRRILDIASVNSAALFLHGKSYINYCRISAGGVAPIPLFLENTSNALAGVELDENKLKEVFEIMNEEISPISDIRGSEKYKRLILRQLILAHLQPILDEKVILKSLKVHE